MEAAALRVAAHKAFVHVAVSQNTCMNKMCDAIYLWHCETHVNTCQRHGQRHGQAMGVGVEIAAYGKVGNESSCFLPEETK